MNDKITSARVIIVDGRYFYGFSPTRRVQRTPYLAGAKRYFPDIHDHLKRDLAAIRKKGWSCLVRFVEVVGFAA